MVKDIRGCKFDFFDTDDNIYRFTRCFKSKYVKFDTIRPTL